MEPGRARGRRLDDWFIVAFPHLSHLLHGLFVAFRYHREREVRREHEEHGVEVSLDAYGTRDALVPPTLSPASPDSALYCLPRIMTGQQVGVTGNMRRRTECSAVSIITTWSHFVSLARAPLMFAPEFCPEANGLLGIIRMDSANGAEQKAALQSRPMSDDPYLSPDRNVGCKSPSEGVGGENGEAAHHGTSGSCQHDSFPHSTPLTRCDATGDGLAGI